MLSFLIVFVIIGITIYILQCPKNLPPGPFNMPFIGSIFFFMKFRHSRPHMVFFEAAKYYGDVMCFWIGTMPVIVLNGYTAVHEALVNQADVFSDRPLGGRIKVFEEDQVERRGIVFNDYGQSWRLMRRFTLQTLKDFGVGDTSLEDKMFREVEDLSMILERGAGKPIALSPHLDNLVINMVFGIVFGKRFDYNGVDNIQAITRSSLDGGGPISPGNFFPRFLVKMFNKQEAIRNANQIEGFRQMRQYTNEAIDEHEATFDNENIRDFIDLYIRTVKEEDENDKVKLDRQDLFRIITDLFLAGWKSTAESLDWVFLYMIQYPDVQNRCQKEIAEVVGDKIVSYSDRKKLVYVEATLLEIQRLSAVYYFSKQFGSKKDSEWLDVPSRTTLYLKVPLSIPHCTAKSTTLYGYNIPKGAIVVPSIYSMCFDPTYWDKPQEFRPERFIDGSGNLISHDTLPTFSTGPRQCLGKPLAFLEMFLVFTILLQRFKFEPEDSSVTHTFQSEPHKFTNSPLPYRLVVCKRI